MRVAEVLTELLSCALDEVDPPVCRSFKHPGANAPHDVCSTNSDGDDGQLWVAHLSGQEGWPTPTGEPTTCTTPWTERFEVGIVRCAQGVLEDDSTAPDEELVTADAEQQDLDRIALRTAFMCCLQLDGKDLIIEGWEATEPLGGCVGGVWTIAIRDDGCDCE